MVDEDVLKLYKALKVKLKATEIMENIYLDELTYVSTLANKQKEMVVEERVKATRVYYKQLEKSWKALYTMLDEECYSQLTDAEKIIFQEFFMNGLTAAQILRKYKALHLTTQSIYNITHKINSQLKRIKVQTFLPKQ